MREERGGGLFSALSGVGAWLIPAWGCPVCLSAFAGTMSTLGLGFLATAAVLTPLTLLLLGAAVVALGLGARRTARYGALVLGVAGVGLLGGSKLWPGEIWLSYVGLASLLGASLWNTRTVAGGRTYAPPASEENVSPIQ